MKPFHAFELESGLTIDLRDDLFPTLVRTWGDAESLDKHVEGATHFGFVFAGSSEMDDRTLLHCESGLFLLDAGMYFASPELNRVQAGSGLLISRIGHRGFFHLGGPIEETGRLRYIDGCTDSLLIPPVVRGDPCLNLLHIPPFTRQTAHTHPSIRVGLIVSGLGECVTPDERYPLRPGLGFVIRANSLHSFHSGPEALRVIAYHPDSDFGPTHEDHPMVNRTIVPPA